MQIVKKIGLSFAALILVGFLAYQFKIRMLAPPATFVTITGKTIHMADLKGKVVLVNFWATTCDTCIKEMPGLADTYNKFKNKDFEMIAVAVDYDPPAQVLNYATQKKLPFKVMHDGYGDVAKQFRHRGITPTTYVYNKSGLRILYWVGDLNFTDLNNLIDKAVR